MKKLYKMKARIKKPKSVLIPTLPTKKLTKEEVLTLRRKLLTKEEAKHGTPKV